MPPEPTVDQLFAALRAARDAKLRNEYDTAVAQHNRQMRMSDTDTDIERSAIAAQMALWDAWAVALCTMPDQPGAPWDGGGEETPWPVKPE
ncbi:hypothetical protein [Desulfovibrio desulfuricans]|uniref:hypothetical protein n=1 Tax=Desulfovibrio desulfuricans TaxID=876 RepID=UPI0039846110